MMDFGTVPQSKPVTHMQTMAINNLVSKPVHGAELRIPQYLSTHNIVPSVNHVNSVNSVDPNAELYKHLLKNVRPQPMQSQMPLRLPAPAKSMSGKFANTFKCDKCNVHAPQLAAMVAHLRNTHKEIARLFQCPYCKDMEAESEAKIHQHIKIHHPTNNPNPPVALSEPAKRHLKTLSVQLPENLKATESNIERDIYQCLMCKIHKYSLETIYEHLEHAHPEVFVFVCPFCKEYKARTEDGVCAHILHVHRKSASDVNISIAIDGNRFSRVQCLTKDKGKKQHSPAASSQHKAHQHELAHMAPKQAHTAPTLFPMTSLHQPLQQPMFTRLSQIPTPTQNHLQTIAALQNYPKTATVQPQVPSVYPNISVQPVTTTQNTVVTSSPSKPTPPPPAQKKKKNLLESIAQLKVQKEMEQQGLVPAKNMGSASPLNNTSPTKSISGVPPPLMKAPPPLIRADQLNKFPSNSSIVSTTVKMSTSTSSHKPAGSVNPDTLTTLQRLQSLAGSRTSTSVSSNPARPIQSSLFDTSDMGGSKHSPRPVLNVPVIPRGTGSPVTMGGISQSGQPHRTMDNVLDLSAKNTPASSPVSHKTPSPKQQATNSPSNAINPDVFKVFNIRPQQLLRPVSTPGQAVVGQPILLPQQVRHNTPSTLAYRPPIPQMIATSQIPQLINMPMGAMFSNMVVSLANVPGGVQAIPGLPTQLVPIGGPAVPVSSLVTVSSASQAIPVVNPGTQGGQMYSMHFKCPYCPQVVPLNFAQVTPHIESHHPGSSILFLSMDAK